MVVDKYAVNEDQKERVRERVLHTFELEQAGRLAYRAGRIPRRLYATASSPEEGVIATHPFPRKSK